VLLGRELLVAEEDDAVFGEGVLHLVPLPVAHRLEIDAQHFGAAAAGELFNLYRFVGHVVSSASHLSAPARPKAAGSPTK
jgi:hypothetical protein